MSKKRQSLGADNFALLRNLLVSYTVDEISKFSGYEKSYVYKVIHNMESTDGVPKGTYLPSKTTTNVSTNINEDTTEVHVDEQIVEHSEGFVNIDSIKTEFEEFIAQVEDEKIWVVLNS